MVNKTKRNIFFLTSIWIEAYLLCRFKRTIKCKQTQIQVNSLDILSSKSLEAKVWKHCPRALTNDEVQWFLHKKYNQSINKDISHVLKRHNYKVFWNDNDNETWTHKQKSVFFNARYIGTRVELLPGFKFTGKMVKIMEFTGKIGKAGKR
jgi:hypothetical protein